MPTCECVPKCPFFNDRMQGLSVMKDMMKKKYCQGDNSKCARYMVFKRKGSAAVPPDLIPNQMDRAKELLK